MISKKMMMALAMTVSVSAVATANAATTSFGDVQGNWAAQDIQTLQQRQLFSAYGQQFQPNAWMSRQEFISLVSRAFGVSENQLMSQFPAFQSVSGNKYGFTEMSAAEMQTMAGQPNNPIRRVEAMAILTELVNSPTMSQAQVSDALDDYRDAALVPAWAQQHVAEAIEADIIANDPSESNEIDPLVPLTRAEAAAMLANTMDSQNLAIQPSQSPLMLSQQPGTTTQQYTMQQQTTQMTPQQQVSSQTYMQQDQNASVTSQSNVNVEEFIGGHKVVTQQQTDVVTSQVRTQPTTSADNLLSPGQTLLTTVATPLFSEHNQVGDQVMVILNNPILSADGKIVIPAGSRILGEVTEVQDSEPELAFDWDWDLPRLSICPPSRTSAVKVEQPDDSAEGVVDVDAEEVQTRANMEIRFNEILTPDNQRFRINGTVATADGRLYPTPNNGQVISGDRSFKALTADMKREIGGLVGTYQGKQYYYQGEALAMADEDLLKDETRGEVLVGVGDLLQVRINEPVREGVAAPVEPNEFEPVKK